MRTSSPIETYSEARIFSIERCLDIRTLLLHNISSKLNTENRNPVIFVLCRDTFIIKIVNLKKRYRACADHMDFISVFFQSGNDAFQTLFSITI